MVTDSFHVAIPNKYTGRKPCSDSLSQDQCTNDEARGGGYADDLGIYGWDKNDL